MNEAKIREDFEKSYLGGNKHMGRRNEYVLSCVSGTWEPATVRGTLVEEGWGAAAGYPGIVLSETAGKVHGLVFTSTELAEFDAWIAGLNEIFAKEI